MNSDAPKADRTEVKLVDLFEEYRRRKLRGASHHTVNQFNVTLRAFSRFVEHEALLSDLDNDVVSEFCWSRVESGLSPATARKNGNNLCALWRYTCRNAMLTVWPDVDLPKEPERTPIAWTPEQLERLFAACDDELGDIAGVHAADWWHALHSVLWDTGERISAVMSAKWCDVDLESGWLTINAESRKGKSRDKSWQLHADTTETLSKIKSPERKLIFPFPYTTLYYRYSRLLKRAGLPHDRKHKFHCLRKSVGSYFEAAGGNATELLDHSSRQVTRAYLDPRIVKPKQASDVLFRIAAPPKEPDKEPDTDPANAVAVQFRSDPECERQPQFSIGDKWHNAGKSTCAVLRLLIESSKPVTHKDIEKALGRALTESARSTVILRVRRALEMAVELPESFDPVPISKAYGIGKDYGAGWTINLPSADGMAIA